MKHFVCIDKAGRILRAFCAPDQETAIDVCGGLGEIKETTAEVNPGTRIWRNGRLQKLPAKPSELHVFDETCNAWVVDMSLVRSRRDSLLNATDWRVMKAAEMGEALAGHWREYRQALRDITKHVDGEIIWPAKPEEGV